jgi:hypothetical protein
VTQPSSMQPLPARVAEAFARFAQAIAAKEGIPAPVLDCRAAAHAQLPDGAVATLWVGASKHARSRCYHLEVSSPGSDQATGTGACSAPDNHVSLGRTGSIVVGSVGMHPAATVCITTARGAATVETAAGYFLVPPHLTLDRDTLHTVTLIHSTGTVLGQVTDLPAPGSDTPVRDG